MVGIGRVCRRRLAGIVVGVRRAFRACLWASPVVGMHAAGSGGEVLRSRTQLLAENMWWPVGPSTNADAALRSAERH